MLDGRRRRTCDHHDGDPGPGAHHHAGAHDGDRADHGDPAEPEHQQPEPGQPGPGPGRGHRPL
ncbi:MAG: hypothetical protein FJW99_03845 [Actinobacteria bacterium]|nr:hypothetical protein [Actinomycetota bacterium]